MARPKKTIEKGTRFGKLTFIEDKGKISEKRVALYECDCGNEAILFVNNVNCGATKTCGECSMGSGRFNPVTEEERVRIKELSLAYSPREIGLMVNRDTSTVRSVLGINKNQGKVVEGYFDWSNYKDIFQII